MLQRCLLSGNYLIWAFMNTGRPQIKKVAMKKVIKICCLCGCKKYKNSIFKLFKLRPFGLSLLIIKGFKGTTNRKLHYRIHLVFHFSGRATPCKNTVFKYFNVKSPQLDLICMTRDSELHWNILLNKTFFKFYFQEG